MTAVTFTLSDAGIPVLYRADPGVSFDELCHRLFASMPRSDQRRVAAEYLRGLLHARGRLSIRGLAQLPSVRANGQSLHHFIANSSWSWAPVRRALAEHVVPELLPEAWVVQPFPAHRPAGRSARARRPADGDSPTAYGVWAAAEAGCAPVNWRLADAAGDEGLGQTLAEAALEPVWDWGMPPLPAVLDARGVNPATLIRTLRSHGMPALLRVADLVSVHAVSSGPTARQGAPRPVSARALADAAANRRRVIRWRPDGLAGAAHSNLVWADRVRLRGPDADLDLVLVSVDECVPGSRGQLWLTDLRGARVDALFRLTTLMERVSRESERVGERLGLHAFADRSPESWHRHATLASAAQAFSVLDGRIGQEPATRPGHTRPGPTAPPPRPVSVRAARSQT